MPEVTRGAPEKGPWWRRLRLARPRGKSPACLNVPVSCAIRTGLGSAHRLTARGLVRAEHEGDFRRPMTAAAGFLDEEKTRAVRMSRARSCHLRSPTSKPSSRRRTRARRAVRSGWNLGTWGVEEGCVDGPP